MMAWSFGAGHKRTAPQQRGLRAPAGRLTAIGLAITGAGADGRITRDVARPRAAVDGLATRTVALAGQGRVVGADVDVSAHTGARARARHIAVLGVTRQRGITTGAVTGTIEGEGVGTATHAAARPVCTIDVTVGASTHDATFTRVLTTIDVTELGARGGTSHPTAARVTSRALDPAI